MLKINSTKVSKKPTMKRDQETGEEWCGLEITGESVVRCCWKKKYTGHDRHTMGNNKCQI